MKYTVYNNVVGFAITYQFISKLVKKKTNYQLDLIAC